MKRHVSVKVPRLASGFAAAVLVAGLALAGGSPAQAQEFGAQDRSADAALGEATVRAALERDLGLTGAELDAFLAASAEATELDAALQEQLGDDYAGSWFDREAGTLSVAVTDATAAELAAEAGAETVEVDRSEAELTAITDELAALVEADPAASDVFAWGIDAESNQVVVTVRAGQADAVDELVAEFGEAVQIEESSVQPQLAQQLPFLDGGIRYDVAGGGSCSTGFNVRNTSTGARYVLTAGHCGNVGQQTSHAGNAIGPFVASFFPTFDDALIQVTNTAFWTQGPWVWTYPGIVTISNTFTDAPVGTGICKSGYRTGWTCGTITAKNQTVTYPGNLIVNGLTRHNACVEQGDSGGSNLNVSSSPYRAEGVTSGAQLHGAALRCGQNATPPVANVSWYFPIADSLAYYGLPSTFGVTLW